jgi:hypothetical protein
MIEEIPVMLRAFAIVLVFFLAIVFSGWGDPDKKR